MSNAHNAGNAHRIMQCSKCGRDTRPPRTLVKDWPGTAIRYGTKCNTCHRNEIPDGNLREFENRPSHEYIVAGLASFLRRRRGREEAALRRDYSTAYPHLAREQASA